MNRLVRIVVLSLMLAPSVGIAQNFDVGLKAAHSGDFETALREWVPLAEQGDAEAQNNLGWMYLKGQGVPQDDAEAVKWTRLAAEQGAASAQYNLGVMYANGQGVPQDDVTAHMWLNLAGANGLPVANASRDRVAALLAPAEVSEALRRAKVCLDSNYRDCD